MLGIVLGVTAPLHRFLFKGKSNFGKFVTEPVHPRRTRIGWEGGPAGVAGAEADDCGEAVSSLGVGGCVLAMVMVGEVGREGKCMLCGRESDFSRSFALGMLLSSEYLRCALCSG